MERPVTGAAPLYEAIGEFKRGVIVNALREHGGNRTRAARALGVQRTYLMRLMRELAIKDPARSASSLGWPARGRSRPGSAR